MGPRTASTTKTSPKPSYSEMVNEVLLSLADRTGSSLPAIKKQLNAQYKLDVKNYALLNALRKGVDEGALIKVKASYKINRDSAIGKKSTSKTAAKKKKSTTTSTTKKATTTKKAATSTTTKKKAAPAKTKVSSTAF